MHLISTLRVVNYRACKDISIDLNTFTPIVGPNNSGKSSLLNALSWMLAPSTLAESDFGDPEQAVFVEINVIGIDNTLLQQLAPNHRQKIEPYLANGSLRVRRICPTPGTTAARTLTKVRDPKVLDDTEDSAWPDNPGGIWASISAIFPEPIRIGAMEDSAEDAAKVKNTTTLGKLIAELTDELISQVSGEYSSAVADIAERLSADGTKRPEGLAVFDQEASAAVADFFPGVDVKIHVPTPELKDLFKGGTLAVYDHGQRRDLNLLGHGAQRSVQMALVRVLADRKAGAKDKSLTATRLLLIDEPELYLHPSGVHAVRESLKKLTTAGYQVIAATHSPLIVEQEDAANTLIVGKDAIAGTFARPTLRSQVAQVMQDSPHQARTIFSLTNSSEILFANRVLIAEGKTEKRLLPELFSVVLGKSMRAHKIALMDAGGVGSVVKARKILDGLGLQSKVVVDLDFAFRGAVDEGWLSSSSPEYLTGIARISALAGPNGCNLDTNGLPTKGGQIQPAEMFVILAQDSQAKAIISQIHSQLLAHNVWLWTSGAIEAHLNLSAKNEAAWSTFVATLNLNGLQSTVQDHATITQFVNWIAT